jgi:hypothetical protein
LNNEGSHQSANNSSIPARAAASMASAACSRSTIERPTSPNAPIVTNEGWFHLPRPTIAQTLLARAWRAGDQPKDSVGANDGHGFFEVGRCPSSRIPVHRRPVSAARRIRFLPTEQESATESLNTPTPHDEPVDSYANNTERRSEGMNIWPYEAAKLHYAHVIDRA